MAAYQSSCIRVLVADDEPIILNLFEKILQPSKKKNSSEQTMEEFEAKLLEKRETQASYPAFDLTLCSQGREVVQQVKQALSEKNPFAVIFLDVRMPPGPDGIWTAEQIREIDQRVNIIIVTGFSDIDPQTISQKVPPADKLLYLQKPFNPLEIKHFAAALGGKWHAEKQLQDTNRLLETQVKERTAELNRLNKKLFHDAMHDTLTGLPNRNLLMERLKRAIAYSKREANYLFAVLFFDLDRFKLVNDSLGHFWGDRLLKAVAERVMVGLRKIDTLARLREENTIARLGGDEFTILLEDIKDGINAVRVAERIKKLISRPYTIEGQEYFTSASMGIVISTKDYNEPEEVLRDADIAMYRAKAAGGARHEIFNATMHQKAVNLMQLETDLRRAVVGEQFKLYFQPTISLESGKIVGFEALIRWQHPEKGLINPADFIPLAEETGIIVPMGNWVLIAACRQIGRWKESFPSIPLFVSVNISSRQFSQTDLIDRIQDTLQETGVDSSALKLEITETVLMENKEAAREVLKKIKSLGIDIYMDDFGTGYSSLGYLHRFPVDLLKIDQSFVSNMHRNRQNLEIVRTILALTQNLKIEATAEGVETAEQMEQLKADGCTYAQGYYFAKPLDPESAVELLSGKRRLF